MSGLSKSSRNVCVAFPNDAYKIIYEYAKKKRLSVPMLIRAATYKMFKQRGIEITADNPTGKGYRTDIACVRNVSAFAQKTAKSTKTQKR